MNLRPAREKEHERQTISSQRIPEHRAELEDPSFIKFVLYGGSLRLRYLFSYLSVPSFCHSMIMAPYSLLTSEVMKLGSNKPLGFFLRNTTT